MDKGINGVTALGFGLEDYIKMFDLTDVELDMNILDCRAGASCFAAQMHEKSKSVLACDPQAVCGIELPWFDRYFARGAMSEGLDVNGAGPT